MRTEKKVPMCVLTIGYVTLIMPSDAGMKMLPLLQSCFEAEPVYFKKESFVIRGTPRVEFSLIHESQIQLAKAPSENESPQPLKLLK